MRIAIATDNSEVSAHFGRCQFYTLVDVLENKITGQSNIKTPGHEPGMLPRFLKEKGVDVVIAGGMGPKAQDLFNELGIRPVIGVAGPIDTVVQAYLDNNLQSGESLCDQGKEGHQSSCDNHS